MKKQLLGLMICTLWLSLLSCTQPRLAQSPLPTPAEQKTAATPSPSPTPNLTMDEALAIAVEAIGVEGEYWPRPEKTKLTRYSVPTKSKEPRYVLAWKVFITARCPFGDWLVSVDAETGQVLSFGDSGWGKPLPDDCPTPHPLPRLTPIPAPDNEPTPLPPNLKELGIFQPETVTDEITNTTPLLFDALPLVGELIPHQEIDWFSLQIDDEKHFLDNKKYSFDVQATFSKPNVEVVMLLYSQSKKLVIWQEHCGKRGKTVCLHWAFTRPDTYYIGLWLKSAGEDTGNIPQTYTIQLITSPTNR